MVSIIAKIFAKLGLGKLGNLIAKFIWKKVVKSITKKILAQTDAVFGWLYKAAYDFGTSVSRIGNKNAAKAGVPSVYEKYIEPIFIKATDEFKRGLKEQSGI